MTKAEVLEALKQMNTEERLEIIETASRLIREELVEQPQLAESRPVFTDGVPPSEGELFKTKVERLSLASAAEVMRPYYEQGSELAMFTDQDSDDFYEYQEYA